MKLRLEGSAIRFLLVGGASAFCYFLLTWVLQREFGMWAAPASGLAYVVTFGGTYILQKQYTFQSSVAHKRALPRYAFAQITSFFLTMIVVHAGTTYFKPKSTIFISLCATVFAACTSYLLSSRWAFANAEKDPE